MEAEKEKNNALMNAHLREQQKGASTSLPSPPPSTVPDSMPTLNIRPRQPREGTVGESEPESSPAQVNSGKLPPWMLRSVSNRWAVPDTVLRLNSDGKHTVTNTLRWPRHPYRLDPVDASIVTNNKIRYQVLYRVNKVWSSSAPSYCVLFSRLLSTFFFFSDRQARGWRCMLYHVFRVYTFTKTEGSSPGKGWVPIKVSNA